jgi:hypothetical protein
MKTMNKAEQQAVKRLAERWRRPYKEMRKAFSYSMNECWIGKVGSMWIGIESDGYIHT